METLVAQVPELKLRKKVETRTIHWSDVRENKNLPEGMVIPIEYWHDDNGNQWCRADIIRYMNVNNILDTINNPVNEPVEMELDNVH